MYVYVGVNSSVYRVYLGKKTKKDTWRLDIVASKPSRILNVKLYVPPNSASLTQMKPQLA